MAEFAAVFGFIKCVKSLIPSMIVLSLIALLHFFNRKKNTEWNLYSFLFLFPLCLMGYSKLYFTGNWIYFNNWLYQTIRPFHGYLYFSVVGMLLVIFFIRNRKLNKKVRTLSIWESDGSQEALQKELIKILSKKSNFMFHYLSKITVYQTAEEISPFSGGILRPYIVLPSKMFCEWSQSEIRTILCHEMIHIRYGHILFLFCFSLLKIYWWINPLFYFAEKKLKEDMELFCDEKCLCYTDTSRNTYGILLLRMLYFLQDIPRENIAAFSQKKNFHLVKSRIEHLNFIEKKELQHPKKVAVIIISLLFLFTVSIFTTSFPRYDIDDSLSLHNERGQLLLYNTPKLREAVQISGRTLHLDSAAFKKLLREERITSEFVYINFGNIQKTPGVGGYGMIAMIHPKDHYKIEYFGIENWRSRLEEFFIKYLI